MCKPMLRERERERLYLQLTWTEHTRAWCILPTLLGAPKASIHQCSWALCNWATPNQFPSNCDCNWKHGWSWRMAVTWRVEWRALEGECAPLAQQSPPAIQGKRKAHDQRRRGWASATSSNWEATSPLVNSRWLVRPLMTRVLTDCRSNAAQMNLLRRISLFLPYERNTEQVRMPAPVGWGGLG